MRRLLTLLSGAIAGFGLYRLLARRRSAPVYEAPPEAEPPADPRAEELRRKLDESRAVVDERDEFESAETTVDAVEPIPDPDERRAAVHAEGRTAVDRMRGSSGD